MTHRNEERTLYGLERSMPTRSLHPLVVVALLVAACTTPEAPVAGE
jgi:hypothetical protein